MAVTVTKLRMCLVRLDHMGRRLEMEIAMDTSADLLTTAEVAVITKAPSRPSGTGGTSAPDREVSDWADGRSTDVTKLNNGLANVRWLMCL
jgi:hypothetical protein